jgi:NAD(P)-dependent dehydrogenase (short-subunit alcohol dehydrogenase family)
MKAGSPFSLAGKRILVTGASSGIGRQAALTCAQMGAEVVFTGRDVARLQAVMGEMPGNGHVHVAADLTSQADMERLIGEAGAVDGVVHAAGISRLAPFRMVNQAHLDDIFSSNTYAPMLLTKGLLAKKQIRANGSIVFVTGLVSHVGPVASGAYAASKAALLGAMRTLGLEVAKQGIRANCIAPGYVRTPMLEGVAQSGGNINELLDVTPLGLGEPEDIAYAAVFYLSDASRWITRNYFVVDGGLSVPMDVFA